MIRLTESQFSALRKPRSAKPRKVDERDFLAAQIADLDRMLLSMPESDYLGRMGFSSRRAALQQQLNALKPRKALPALAKAHVRLKEADVTKQCKQLMEAHGWTAIRLQRGLARRKDGTVWASLGVTGMCDWCFVKAAGSPQWAGHARFFLCEFKAPSKKPDPDQLQFMVDCRKRGLVAEYFDNYEYFAEFARLTFGVK